MPHNKTIAVIGAGHLGSAFIHGLIKSGFPSSSIIVSNGNFENSMRLASSLNVLGAPNNSYAVEMADIVILAVKPQLMEKVCNEIAEIVKKERPLIISLAGVISLESIAHWLNVKELGIVRVMTNTPMEHGRAVSALYANTHLTTQQSEMSEALFNLVGSTFWVKTESMIDTMTAAIGCSPAYVFLFMEALQKAAQSQGIPEELACLIALQVIAGSAELASHSNRSFTQLRESVCTPNGVTAYSLKKISANSFFESFEAVYKAAEERIEQIKQPHRTAKL